MSDAAAFDDSLAPFSRSRRGFVMGEGGFVLWLTRGGRRRSAARSSALRAASAELPLNAWPPIPSRSSARCRWPSRMPGLQASDVRCRVCVGQCDRRLDEVEARALSRLFGGSRTDGDVDQGRDWRMRRVGRRGLRGGGALRSGRARAADCRLADADPIAARSAAGRYAVDAPGEIVLVNSVASGGALGQRGSADPCRVLVGNAP